MAPIRALAEMGFRDHRHARHQAPSRRGTASPCERVNKVLEGRPHVVDAIKNGEIDLVFNTTEGAQALAEFLLDPARRLAQPVPYYTTMAGARGRDPGHPGAARRQP